DDGVALVPGRRDRVEAPTRALEPARCEVAVAAFDLRAPGRLGVADQVVVVPPSGELPQAVEQVALERVEVFHQARMTSQPARSFTSASTSEPKSPVRRPWWCSPITI